MAQYFGGSENAPAGWRAVMLVYAAMAVLLFFATFLLTRERVQAHSAAPTRLVADLADLRRNKPWLVVSLVGIAALTFSNLRGTVSIFYFENVVPGGRGYFGPVMTTGALAFLAGVMLTGPLSRRLGKRRLYFLSIGLAALSCAGFYYVPPSNIEAVWTVNTLINFFAAPTAPLIWAMYADTADYSESLSGRRATGLVFSAASFAQKLGRALGGAGAGWLLAFYQYHSGQAQSPETIRGIVLLMSWFPALAAVLAGIGLFFYPLDDASVERIGRELVSLRERPRT
jgi:GPH family glycoside/pentoside/hexuronide:cation symporter